MKQKKTKILHKINKLIEEYFKEKKNDSFKPGKDFIQYAGGVFDDKEIKAIINSVIDGWFGLNTQGKFFEKKFPEHLGKTSGILVNSGSSANLVAISALCSKQFSDQLKPGDEVITCTSSFPTTVNPILNNRLVPVFVDAQIGNYNIDVNKLEDAVLSPKTRALFFAHTLGNPVDMNIVQDFVKKHNLILIEDCCDALGSTFDNKKLGSFGRMATSSFYPAHHMTLGEGGFLSVDSHDDLKIIQAIRDWGRACFCSGKDSLLKNGVCNNRFSKRLDGIDEIIDHKYVYSEIGYNLKPLELQAAMGIVQLDRLPFFKKRRKENFKKLYSFYSNYEDFFILPESHQLADPCWFAFPLTVKKDAPFSRIDLESFLKKYKSDDILYATLGTVFNKHANLMDIVIKGVVLSKVTAVISTGPGYKIPEEIAAQIPENVKTVSWANHRALFPHIRAALTHGGMSTTSDTIYFALPTLHIPVGCDLPSLSRKIVNKGAGLRIPHFQATPEAIAEKIPEIITSKEMKKNITKLQKSFLEAGGAEKAVELIERAASLVYVKS